MLQNLTLQNNSLKIVCKSIKIYLRNMAKPFYSINFNLYNFIYVINRQYLLGFFNKGIFFFD